MMSVVTAAALGLVPSSTAAPIIGGYGKYRYQYMPDLVIPPEGAVMKNCHGLVLDAENNIYLTYENDGDKDKDNCLIRWKPDGTGGEFMSGGNATLCSGTPHGLKIATEVTASGATEQFLYHANNAQKLTKTKLDGTIVWQRTGNFGQDPNVAYRPTWFAVPPKSEYIYLCDGYGSNNVYVFNRDGIFVNKTFGGKGGRDQHGKFATNHGCTYDPRNGMIAVSDRANSRFEYFRFSDTDPSVFEYDHTHDMQPVIGPCVGPGCSRPETLPCNLRMYPEQEGRAISPDLDGPVAVLDGNNALLSIVNVSVLLAAQQHKHPHDAIFLPNGDMVVATWAPGRVSYWKRL